MGVLAQRRGFSPLAARPAKRLSIVCFALRQLCRGGKESKTLTLVRGSPFESSSILVINNKKHPNESGVFRWRREEDSNLRYVSGAHTISNRAP